MLLPSPPSAGPPNPHTTARRVAALAGFAAQRALFAAVQLLVFGRAARSSCGCGDEVEPAASLVRMTVLAAGHFVFYLTMRGSLDAVAVARSEHAQRHRGSGRVRLDRGRAARGRRQRPAFAVAWAFRRRRARPGAAHGRLHPAPLPRPGGRLRARAPIALAAATGGGALLARPVIEQSAIPLPLLIAAELVLTTAYLGGLVAARAGWTGLLRERALRRGR